MSGPLPGMRVCRHVGNPDTCRACAAEREEQPDVQSPMSNYRDLSAEVAESAGSSPVGESS